MPEEIQAPQQVQDKVTQFETMQQQLQIVSLQKQQLIRQANEVEVALKELEKITDDDKISVYKNIGPILLESAKSDSEKSLKEDKELIENRVKILENEEKRLTEKLTDLKSEVQSMIQNLQKGGQNQINLSSGG